MVGSSANEETAESDSYEQPRHSSLKPGKTLEYRSVDNGYWVAFLLPIAFYIRDLDLQRETLTAVTIITYNAFLLCIVRWFQCNSYMLFHRLKMMNIAVSFLVLLIVFVAGGEFYEVASYMVLNFTFPYVFYNLVKQHPKSFSFGEGVLVTSAFAYRFWGASQSLPFPQTENPISSLSETDLVRMLLQLVFFGTILGARYILLLQKPWKLFILEEMLCLWAKYCVIAFFIRIPMQNDEILKFLVIWPFKFLVANSSRVILISIWAMTSMLTIIFLALNNFYSRKTTTIHRKVFHFAIILVFLPGIIVDHALIYCCSSIVFYLFLLVEAMRVVKLDIFKFKIGKMINSKVCGFRDYQDEGRLLLTPIYLLVGCSLPIWLTHVEDAKNLQPVQYSACIAGILSIGIGDTFASIGGTMYGRTRWRGSKKTLEGTVCSIFAQMIFALLIFLTNFIPYNTASVCGLFLAILINAIVEGNTNQIDNLVLPLVTYIVIHGFNLVIPFIVDIDNSTK